MKEALGRSLEEGLVNLERIASEEAQRTGLPAATISSYLRRNIQFRLGAAESDSLRVFYRMCRERGLLAQETSEPDVTGRTTTAFVRAARPRETADDSGTPS